MTELSYWKVLTRRKTISDSNQRLFPKIITQKQRLELSNVGIATSCGIGIFAIIGFVARNVAGPSVIVAIPCAAILAFTSGTFYAELSSRITKNASTFTYIYVCIGEFQAFIVGWTIILEYIIGIAIVSDSMGLYVDNLLNDTIKKSFQEFAPMHWSAMASYFDFIGFAIPIFFAIIVNVGLKRSVFLNKIFVIISVAITLFIVIAGAFRAQSQNWYIVPDPLLTNQGTGGFAPFQYFGILKGITVCIFIFIGFDVTGTGTRWKSLYGIVSFVFVTAALVSVGIVVTLAQPFYLMDEYAQLPQIFNIPSWYTGYWIIAIGGIIVLFASMYGLMFSMQITVLAMAKDSLLPKSFDSDKHTKPIIEILCAGLIAGLLAGLFRMVHLIDMLSIGIMFGFMAMAFAVVMFRYSNEYEYGSVSTIDVADSNNLPDKEEKPTTFVQVMRQLFKRKTKNKPTSASYAVVKILLVGLGLVSLGLAWMANFAYLDIYNLEVWAITLTPVLLVILIIIIFLISLQPMRKLNAIFMVPFVPLSPAISIFVNIYLMMSLHYYAWIRFGIWIIFGIPIYFYCIVKYNRRQMNSIDKSTKNVFKNNGFIGDIERHPSFSFNSQSQMTYKSDDFIETENINVDQTKLDVIEMQREIPTSPKSSRKPKAPIPMSFKSEKPSEAEPSRDSSLVRKSRTPSPNNKTLDDIVLMSDVIDRLTEMREPNGKTYFVDENKIPAPATSMDMIEESEQKTAIAYLDDVLKKQDVVDENLRGKTNEGGYSTSVVAVVHLNAMDEPHLADKESVNDERVVSATNMIDLNDEKGEELSEEISKNSVPNSQLNESNLQDVPIKESIEDKVSDNIPTNLEELPNTNEIDGLQQVLNNEKTAAGHSNTVDENDTEKSLTFKERLAMLLVQPVAEVRRTSPKANDRNPEHKPEPTLKHSKSEPDIMQSVFKDIRSKYEPNEPESSRPPSLLRIKATDDIFVENSNSNVPAPPKFDPFIYKTMGSRHNARMPLKMFETNSENDVSPKGGGVAPIIMEYEVVLRKKSIEDDDQTRMISIKDRLENILKRGPPDRFSRPKSISSANVNADVTVNEPASVKSVKVESEKIEEENQEMIHIKQSKKPFDTVHKQKVLFNDVLKSIGVETRPSIIRANSVTNPKQKPNTIEGARNALKHISPDWKKNVD